MTTKFFLTDNFDSYGNIFGASEVATTSGYGSITIANSTLTIVTSALSGAALVTCPEGLSVIDAKNSFFHAEIKWNLTSLALSDTFVALAFSVAASPSIIGTVGVTAFGVYTVNTATVYQERWFARTAAGSICYYNSTANTWGTAAGTPVRNISLGTWYTTSIDYNPVTSKVSFTNGVQSTITPTMGIQITNPMWWQMGDYLTSDNFGIINYNYIKIIEKTHRRTFSNNNALTTTKTKYRNPIGGSALTEKIGFSTTSYGRLTGASRILGTTPTVKKLRERTKT